MTYVIYRLTHIDSNTAVLIGVGSSICGGSAIAAAAPVIKAEDQDIAQAISVVFFFNVVAAFVFPQFGDAIGLSNMGFGLFAGTAVNDTSSVTATAAVWDSMKGTDVYKRQVDPFLLKTNVADMERYTGIPVLAVVPPYQGPDIQKVQLGWARSFIDSKKLWNTVLGL